MMQAAKVAECSAKELQAGKASAAGTVEPVMAAQQGT